MTDINNGSLDTLVQEKLDTDIDFQESLEALEEEDREQAILEKRAEIINQEYSTLRDSSTKNEELAGNYKTRAEKAEALNKQGKEVDPNATKNKSEGFDYGQKAFLVANGVKGEKETELIQKVMSETGKTIEQVLSSKYFKADLEEMRELETTENATIEGKRQGNGAVDSVEYWAAKPFSEVPKDMRQEVVNYKLKKEDTGGNFYNS